MPVPSFRPFWTQQVPGIFEREGGGFFSKLAQLLTEKMPQRASGAQVLGIAQGAKPAEAEWIGLSRFLEPEQQYMKPDVLRYVQERTPSLRAVPRLEISPFEIISPSAPMVPETQNLRHIGVPQAGFMNPDYQLAGGKDYREIPVHIGKEQIREQYPKIVRPYLPDVEGHFSPNTVFHMRTTDRQLPTGEKVLFGEEIQSDWHQKARAMKEEGGMGYIPREIGPRVAEEKIKFDEAKVKLIKDVNSAARSLRAVSAQTPDWSRPLSGRHVIDDIHEAEKKYWEAQDRLGRFPDKYEPQFGGALPVGPFEKSWPELSIKKMLNDAVARGYDGIGWTTGDQQLRRYASLSERVGALRWEKTPNGYALYAQGQEFGGIDPKDLASWVGASAAKKILAGEGVNKLEATNPRVLFRGVGNVGLLEGEEIQLGGKGMRRFYDEILPNTANNYAKKWGVKVQDRDVSTVGEFPVGVDTPVSLNGGSINANGIPIAVLQKTYSGYVLEIENSFIKSLQSAGFAPSSISRSLGFVQGTHKTSKEALSNVKQAVDYLRTQFGLGLKMTEPIHYLPITSQMRKDILTKGQPLWQFAPTAIGLGAGATALSDQQELPS